MGFKDTVMSPADIEAFMLPKFSYKLPDSIELGKCMDMVEAQAEISWKAAYKYALEGAVMEGAYESIKKLGRQEVVEWFMKYGGGGLIRYSSGVKARFDPNWDELQSKLKDWGIDPNGTEKPLNRREGGE